MDSSPSHLSRFGRGITRADIDAWSLEIRQAQTRLAHRRQHGASADATSTPPTETDLELSYEELAVAEAELRAQYEDIASSQLQLERERARYRDLFERAPVPYLVTDPVGTILDANFAAANLLGADAQWLRGKPVQTFVPLGGRPRFRQSLAELGGAHVVPELVFMVSSRQGARKLINATLNVVRDRDGRLAEVRWLLSEQKDAIPQTNDGDPAERRVVRHSVELDRANIERERALVEAEQIRRDADRRVHAATDLLTTVSHELRTPMSAILGYADLLAMGIHGPLTPPQERDVERVVATVHHVVGLLDQLLLYFRAGGSSLPIQQHTVDLDPVVGEAVSLVRPLLDAKQLTLNVHAPSETANVRADADRVRQILINLIANAVKYSRDGGMIDVGWQAETDEVDITVADNGVGIAPEDLEHIFEPFVQLNALPADASTGFGLGLAISRKLARAMCGDLSATSTLGAGATFVLRLPRSE
jgi:PAS domain S-box-containing protein